MTIQNVVDLAKSSVLQNLAVKNDVTAITGYINLGLVELYKRFPLKVEEAIISLVDGKTTYTLDGSDPDVSMSVNSDFMWAVAAYEEVNDPSSTTNEVITVEIPINEEENEKSLNTINYNQVQVPITSTGAYISIIYVAAPRWYSADELDMTVPIPQQMLQALLYYVGYSANISIDANLNAENTTFYSKFLESCNEITRLGMFTNDDMSMQKKFETRGFM